MVIFMVVHGNLSNSCLRDIPAHDRKFAAALRAILANLGMSSAAIGYVPTCLQAPITTLILGRSTACRRFEHTKKTRSDPPELTWTRVLKEYFLNVCLRGNGCDSPNFALGLILYVGTSSIHVLPSLDNLPQDEWSVQKKKLKSCYQNIARDVDSLQQSRGLLFKPVPEELMEYTFLEMDASVQMALESPLSRVDVLVPKTNSTKNYYITAADEERMVLE